MSKILPTDNKTVNKTAETVALAKDIMRDAAVAAGDCLDAFLFSFGSSRQLAKNMGMIDRKYYSSMQSLQRSGYIKKVNEDQFLITPKMIVKLVKDDILETEWKLKKWDGNWIIITFDIPESQRYERDYFRSVIQRKGFIGIQNSVFIAPFANLDQLANLRASLKVQKYVSIFIARSAEVDNDEQLRKRFDLE